jgi:hypothetical protein
MADYKVRQQVRELVQERHDLSLATVIESLVSNGIGFHNEKRRIRNSLASMFTSKPTGGEFNLLTSLRLSTPIERIRSHLVWLNGRSPIDILIDNKSGDPTIEYLEYERKIPDTPIFQNPSLYPIDLDTGGGKLILLNSYLEE